MSDEVVQDLLRTFYKGRSLKNTIYDYSPDGDLVEMDKSHKSIVRTILKLNEYRPITAEEREEMESIRNEAIAIASKNYDDAKKRLREEIMSPNRSDTEYLRRMREVATAEGILFYTRSPMHHVQKLFPERWKNILFDEMDNDTRVIPYPVCILRTSPFLLKEMYVRVGKEADTPLMTVKEIKKAQKKSEIESTPVILFSSPDDETYGFLSMDWRVNITVQGTTYHSARQAWAVELAKLYGDDTHVAQFMEMESPEGIRYTLEDVPEEKGIDRSRWTTDAVRLLYEIHAEKFSNYPALGAQLLETGSAFLGASEPGDMLLGIGLSKDNPLAMIKSKWTGQNMIGKSIMDIRDSIKKHQSLAPKTMKRPASKAKEIPPSSAPVQTLPSPPSSSAVPISIPVNVQPAQPRILRRPPKASVAALPSTSST